jgi:phage terminase large subunit GpA-like protein
MLAWRELAEQVSYPNSMTTLADVRRKPLAALKPPPKLALSAWIEASVHLPQGLAATPGPMKLWPFQREIADSIGDPAVERVSVQKATRVGFSSLLSGVVANYVCNDACPVLVVLPVESDCRDYMVADLEPLFEASPTLRGKLQPPSRRPDERSTILHRIFPGGSLKLVAARAPRNLRRHSARILLCDEIDAMEVTWDPIPLAEKGTLSFQDRKIVCGSTPLDEASSHILRLFEASDQRIFEVACPSCGEWFEILWRCIEWPEGRPEEACCVCPAWLNAASRRKKRANLGCSQATSRWLIQPGISTRSIGPFPTAW